MYLEYNHRNEDRAPFSGTVALWQDRQPHLVQARDVGPGGMFLATLSPVEEGTLLTLRVVLPGDGAFTVLGRVVRRHARRAPLARNGIAVQFVDIRPRHREQVRRYVQRFRERTACVC